MSKEDGGPAFPYDHNRSGNEEREQAWGMTLRDYFAAKAMQGLLAQAEGSALESNVEVGAEYAYRMADAMLKERDK